MAANQLITNPEETYFNYFDDRQYYDLNSINNYIDTNTPKSINIIHINIRSARKNLDEFLINLERTTPFSLQVQKSQDQVQKP